MIATETELDEIVRDKGAYALLYHDILEDTKMPLPEWITPSVVKLVLEMTFPGGMKQEQEEVWQKTKEARLLKLYDKVSNLLDGKWMTPEKREAYNEYTNRLCEDVEREYGELSITKIARAIINP